MQQQQIPMQNLAPNNLAVPLYISDDVRKEFPWQYQGYPGLSRWMAASKDLFMLRRYSAVTARYLLYLQNEIGKRERILDECDDRIMRQPPGTDTLGTSGSFEKDRIPERRQALQEIGPLLIEYYNLINAYSGIRCKPTADEHHIKNLKGWFRQNPTAIAQSEKHFWNWKGVFQDGDIFEMISIPRSPLRWLLHKSRIMRFLFPVNNERSDRIDIPGVRHHSDIAFDQMVCFVTVLIGLALLFAPMWGLHYVQNTDVMLGIITAFVTVFAFWLWVAAGPRQFEILLGTAAYAAVLYIYLQAAKPTSP